MVTLARRKAVRASALAAVTAVALACEGSVPAEVLVVVDAEASLEPRIDRVEVSVRGGLSVDALEPPYTETIARRMEDDRAIVPPLWQLEFANVLRTACRKKRLVAAQAHAIIDQICGLPIAIDTVTPGPAELLALALRHNLSSYDAAYLELALRLQIPVATKDGPLRDAAEASGVGLA